MIGSRDGLARAADAFGFDGIVLVGPTLLAQSRGVDQLHRHAVDLERRAQRIARGAGHRRDDGRIEPHELVHQRALASVGAAGDHHGEAARQQRAAACRLQHLAQQLANIRHALGQFGAGQEVDLLFREINRRFNVDAQLGQRRAGGLHACGEFTLQRSHRGAGRAARTSVDQVGDGFGLREVDLVVEEGPLGKFTGPRAARAQFHHALDQRLDDQAGVALQFEHILAGERARRGEEDGDAGIDDFAGGIAPAAEGGLARGGQAAQQRLGNGRGHCSGYAHNGDPAAARRGRGGNNRVASSAQRLRPRGAG